MTMPAGAPSPSGSSFADVATVCAIDGDGTALCNGRTDIAPVNGYTWADVPSAQRCRVCAFILDQSGSS
jgi:hypothetical protein